MKSCVYGRGGEGGEEEGISKMFHEKKVISWFAMKRPFILQRIERYNRFFIHKQYSRR